MLHQEHGQVTTSLLSEHLGVAPPSVTGMFHKLAKLALAIYRPYQGVTLTVRGEYSALDVLRRHRLLELFLPAADSALSTAGAGCSRTLSSARLGGSHTRRISTPNSCTPPDGPGTCAGRSCGCANAPLDAQKERERMTQHSRITGITV